MTPRSMLRTAPAWWLPIGLAWLCLGAALANAAPDRPNVVILLADDLGWNAVGYHNREFQTPHIDQLVRDGVELDRFYVAPMCTPTRAGLMTGRYPIRFGLARAVIPPYRDFGLPPEETTLAEALAELGYRQRGVFGKWHLGHRRGKWHPFNQGFTRFHGHFNGAIDYFQLTREGVRDWHDDDQPSTETGYATDLIAKAAAEWITQAAAADSPYLCYVPFNAPHSPFQAPEAAKAKFGVTASGEEKRSGPRRRKTRNRKVYQAMIWQMDRGIGKILEAIERSGESDRTLVWFFSDNGGVRSLSELNTPLRGGKLTVYEGGIRVPACIRWPQRLPAGSRCDVRCGDVDVLPTLVSAAGGNPRQVSSRPLDGVNLLPILTDDAADSATAETLDRRPWFSYHGQQGEQNEHLAVTLQGWKLKIDGPRLTELDQLTRDDQSVELFHLQQDPYESTNLAESHPDRVRRLAQRLIEYRALQPEASVLPYRVGRRGFVPPPKWRLDPQQPNRLVGRSEP